jgi:hypothetical protein
MSERGFDINQAAIPATFLGLGLLAAYVALSVALGPGFAIPVGILGIIGSAVVTLGPVGKAIAGRISGRANSGLLPEEAEEILSRLQEFEQVQSRLAELEERLDFTERLLAESKRQAERLEARP